MGKKVEELSLKEIHQRFVVEGDKISGQMLRKLQRDARSGAQKIFQLLQKRRESERGEDKRLASMLHFEHLLWKAGIRHVAGVDEVGVGPLAGPVAAAAVVFPPDVSILGLDDSKKLDPTVRFRLDQEIRQKALGIGVGQVEVDEIDRLNIYHAGLKAMRLALENLPFQAQHVLVDAKEIPGIPQPQNCFVKGDGLNFSIAAASVVAKVYRDRLMVEYDRRYPEYGFAHHKGYGTSEHQQAIAEYGPCPIHRKSFDVIRELCGEYGSLFYTFKRQLHAVQNREALRAWEESLKARIGELSEKEARKLHALGNRFWERYS